MHEFLIPRLQEMGEEREMLVDDEYELYQDHLQSVDMYPSSHLQEAAPVPSAKELNFGTQWLRDSEPPELQGARSMVSLYSPEAQQYGYSTENMVRDENSSSTSLLLPLPPNPCSKIM